MERLRYSALSALAFLMLLEQLQPFERAVFLLRGVFEYEFAEVATAENNDRCSGSHATLTTCASIIRTALISFVPVLQLPKKITEPSHSFQWNIVQSTYQSKIPLKTP